MTSWIDQLAPIAGIALLAWVAWLAYRKLTSMNAKQHSGDLHLSAFCTHCGWHGKVSRKRMACGKCGSSRLSVTAT
jgi:Zn finger protein HypA/HybF involved in hydrogenase expression